MPQFSFKPALLVGAHSYDLGDDDIVCRNKSGTEKWRARWADITGAGFVERTVKGSRFRRLDLRCGPKAPVHSVSYTGPRGDPTGDPDSVQHLLLLSAILERLGRDTENFQVSVGEYGKQRLAIFIVGIATLIGGLVLGGLVLGTGVSNDRMGEAVVPVLVLLAMGAMLIWSNATWRPVPYSSAGVLAKAMASMADSKSEPY